jgi:lysine 2,3-aminomutase
MGVKKARSQMEVSTEDRSVALARSAEVKALEADYLAVRENIPTGLKLEETYALSRERVLEALGGDTGDWDDYRWHLKNRIAHVETLERIIHLTPGERVEIEKTAEQYRWGISPFYASLMDPEDRECPVRKQAVPSIKEHLDQSVIADPMIIKYNSPAPLISRLYPDRLIINVTNMCSMFCRHCLRRKDIDFQDVVYPVEMVEEALGYIRENGEIRDVLFTGGGRPFPDRRVPGFHSR